MHMLSTLLTFFLAWHTKTKLEAEGMQDFPSQNCHTEITTQDNILDPSRTTLGPPEVSHFRFLLSLQLDESNRE